MPEGCEESTEPTERQSQHSILAERLYRGEIEKIKIIEYLALPHQNAVLVEYLELFDFHDKDLLVSLREFLSKFTLKGETQEQDRILQAFANRYAQCNSGGIFSAETAHKIVYAIILLNTDLYINSANGFKKMELEEFLENTRGALHDDSEETRALLQSFYKSIEKNPIIQPDDSENNSSKSTAGSSSIIRSLVRSMSLRSTVKQDGKSKTINYSSTDADKLEPYKQGPVRIKRVLDKSGQRASDRRWKEYFAYLNASDLILCRPLSPSRPLDHLPLRHSISSVLLRKYSDKHQYTLQLITMKGEVFLMSTDSLESVQEWTECMNWWAARESREPLPSPICNKSFGFESDWLLSFIVGEDKEKPFENKAVQTGIVLSEAAEQSPVADEQSAPPRSVESVDLKSIGTWTPPHIPFVPHSLRADVKEVSFGGKETAPSGPLGYQLSKLADCSQQLAVWISRYDKVCAELTEHLESKEALKYFGIGKGVQEVLVANNNFSHYDDSTQTTANDSDNFDAASQFDYWSTELIAAAAVCPTSAHLRIGGSCCATGDNLPPRTDSLVGNSGGSLDGSVVVTLPPPSNLIINLHPLPDAIVRLALLPPVFDKHGCILSPFPQLPPKCMKKIRDNWYKKFNFLQWEACRLQHFILALQNGVESRQRGNSTDNTHKPHLFGAKEGSGDEQSTREFCRGVAKLY